MEISDKLEKLYKNEKSRNFVLHLIRAYLPLNKTQKVFITPDDLKKFKCSLTGAQLISVDGVFNTMNSEEYEKGFIDDLRYNTGIAKKPEGYEPLMKRILKGRVLGYQGKNTSTYLSYEGATELFNWVTIKILQDDKKIIWTLNEIAKKEGGPVRNSIQSKGRTQRKPPVTKPSITTLGDLDSLQQLKVKMESK